MRITQAGKADRRYGKGKPRPSLKCIEGIYAGTRGFSRLYPALLLTVLPNSPHSFAPKRKGYRWVCSTADGSTVFIPFRDFVKCEPEPEPEA